MNRLRTLAAALYRGEVSFDFVGKRRRWYLISGIFLVLAAIGLFGRGLNLGIEFKGGAEFSVQSSTATVEQARTAVESVGISDPTVTKVGAQTVRIQTLELSAAQTDAVVKSLSTSLGVPATDVTVQNVGATWGRDITQKALQGLLAFLVCVFLFLIVYFEWRMAVAAMVALAHDVLITVGIYALTGFEVTPATVIGFLTILGFSLYDTVVVFDKVKENTRGIASGNRTTYSEATNLALNQTLVRSINTSVVALLPVASILLVGVLILGAGTLKDLALALFIGTAVGAYSSIFIATPFLAWLEEMKPANKALAKRVALRKSGLDARKSVATTPKSTKSAILVAEVGDDGDTADVDSATVPAAADPGSTTVPVATDPGSTTRSAVQRPPAGPPPRKKKRKR